MGSLLQTIMADGILAARFASMPADAKTVTLALESGRSLVPLSDAGSDLRQTFALPSAVPDAPLDGFVPKRKVITLATRSVASKNEIEYRLIGKLGSGGTGVVYQAHQRAIDREVAIKVLRPELTADSLARSRFLAEARVIGSMDHPNVIAVHDLCRDDDGQLFYAMPRIDGTSWNLQLSDLAVERNLEILLRVCDAVRYAHSRGLIHRDLKPENVMLGRFGEVLVADWGLAMRLSHAADQAADTDHAIGGTPAYMAPELAGGNFGTVGHGTDVYLLGAILYQILTGFPPHHGENLLECIQAAANNIIRPTHVQGELMDVAMRAMATSISDRFASVTDFVAAIQLQDDHAESERLVRRGRRRVWEDPATESDPYARFRAGEALIREALELWPKNPRGLESLKRLQIDYARVATQQGDLDLAIVLYEAANEGKSEAGQRVRKYRDRRLSDRRRQAKYSALFTQSPEAGLLVRWSDGDVLEVNAAFLEMLGFTQEDLVGRKIQQLPIWVCPERRAVFVDQLKQDGRIDNFEAKFLRQSGNSRETAIDVLISARLVEVDGEEVLLSTIRDISLRKAAEMNLRQNQQRLRDLQRLAGLGTWTYCVQTQQITWTEETFLLTGRDPSRGEPGFDEFVSMIHPDDRPKLQDAIQSAIQTGTSYGLMFRQRDDAGDYRKLRTRGQPVVDASGQVAELYGVLMAAD